MTQKIIIIFLLIVTGLVIGLTINNYSAKKSLAENNTKTNTPSGQVKVLETNITNQNTPMPDQNAISATQATIKTNLGDITVKFYNEDAPKTVANFIKLASEGFYDGIKFHRVIKDFMIQSGDPLTKDNTLKDRWGTGGPGYQFADEINSHKLVAGSLAMANSGANTNGSQFFIVTTSATPWLDGKHTNFGEVIDGLDIVKLIENSETTDLDRPTNDIVINSIELK
jgi:cyclophilin family peptidyl-prolyl cis-trans isomerase